MAFKPRFNEFFFTHFSISPPQAKHVVVLSDAVRQSTPCQLRSLRSRVGSMTAVLLASAFSTTPPLWR